MQHSVILAILLVFFMVLLFFAFAAVSKAGSIQAQKKLLKQEEMLDKNIYNEYGLPEGQELSEELLYDMDGLYIYSDRAVKQLEVNDENARYFSRVATAFYLKFGKSVKLSVMPIPHRVMFEPVSGSSNEEYKSFLTELSKGLWGRATVIDCSLLISENGGRNLFYRTDDKWTMPGAYYGYRSYMESMGKEPYPEDHFILYQNNSFRGDTFSLVSSYDGEYRKLHYIAKEYPDDPFYFRLSEGAKNYEEVRDDSEKVTYKRPVVTYAVAGSDSIVGNSFDFAKLPGKGEGCLLLIADNSGKEIAPYLAENYETVVVFDIAEYDGEDYKEVLKDLDVTEVLVAQAVDYMGLISYSRFLNAFLE